MGIPIKPTILFATIGILAFSGCLRNHVEIPPVTEEAKGVHTYGRFVWHDLLTDDIAAAKKFYERIFGWRFTGRGGEAAPYLTAYNDEVPVAGIVKSDRLEADRSESRWIGYISVPDINKTASRIIAFQGIIFSAPRELSRRGMVALAGDPRGGHFGLITTWDGDPPERPVPMHAWIWNELFIHDQDTLIDFYEKVFNYSSATDVQNYTTLNFSGDERAGVVPVQKTVKPPFWISYIRVADLDQALSTVESAGGKILFRPKLNINRQPAAIIADPTDAILGIQEW